MYFLLEGSTLSSFLTDIGTIVTQIVAWVGTVAETIVTTPLLVFSLGFFAIGGAVGIIGRMLSRG